MSKRWWACLFGIALIVGSASSFGQTDEQKASARSLATQGFEAFQAQRWAEAADLFSRAESLVHSVTHVVYVARSLEKQGKLVKARETYLKVTRETLEANAPPAAKQAQQEATSELAQLEPRIPMLQVTLENAPAGGEVSVTIDGTPLPPALIGVSGPVDPGTHELVATAPGMQSAPVKIDVAEGSKQTAALRLEPSSGAPAGSGPATGDASGSAAAQLDTGGIAPLKLAGFIALGVGVVGLGAGAFFTIKSNSKTSEWQDLCAGPDGTNCPVAKSAEIDSLKSDADGKKTLATVGFIAGGVGVAAGVTLLVLDATKKSPEHAAIMPFVGPRSLGVTGRF